MPSYLCPRCGFKTSQRANFKRHLTRKHICDSSNKDVSIESIANSYGIEIPSTENFSVTQNVTPENRVTVTRNHTPNVVASPISDKNEENVTHRHKCEFCNKSFATRQGKYRHKKQCKIDKKLYDKKMYTHDEIEKIKQAVKDEVKKEVTKEVEEKVEVLADKKAQKMVLCLVDKLMPNQTTTNSHNNSHNTTITQNNQTNNNQQVKINNFGEEKTKYITDAKLKIMFVDPRNVIVQHIKDTYYHVLHPENFNAKITNCKSKHMHIYKDNDWEKVNKQLTICSMYNKHEKIIENEFERLKPELTDTVRDNYKEYKQSTLHSFNVFKQRMVDIEAVIINGTKKNKQIDLLSEKEVARLAKEQGKTPGEIFAEHMPDIFGGDEE